MTAVKLLLQEGRMEPNALTTTQTKQAEEGTHNFLQHLGKQRHGITLKMDANIQMCLRGICP